MTIKISLERTHMIVSSDKQSFDEEESKSCIDELKKLTEQRPLVVFDFSGVVTVSSAALRNLTRAVSSFAQGDAKIAVVSNRDVAKVIKDQGLDRLFGCYSTMSEALGPHDLAGARQRALEFLNTTLEAVAYTLQVSANTQVTAGKTFLRDKNTPPPDAHIAATVGLVSAPFTGSLILGFPLKTYLGIMSRLLGEEYKEMTPEIRDGVAELLNIILGQVKISLNQKGFAIKQAIPTVIQGENISITPSSSRPSVIVPYTADIGGFYIELTTNPDGKG